MLPFVQTRVALAGIQHQMVAYVVLPTTALPSVAYERVALTRKHCQQFASLINVAIEHFRGKKRVVHKSVLATP